MTQRERTNVTVVKRRRTAPRSSLAWRLFALVFAVVAGLLAMALSVMLSTAQAQASPQYTFTKVADSAQDGFDPFSFECSAINNRGDIAFEESVDSGGSGIFVTEGSGFKTIAEPDPNVIVGRPNLNDAGTVAFHRFFNDRAGEELVSGNGGPLTVIADTSGPFQSFGFYFGFTPPALNDNGDVAFLAELDSSGGTGIFVGPDPVGDRVIGTGDTLDGSSVTNFRFCDEGLNDSGQLAFQATFDDPNVPDGRRVAIYRATPVP